MQGGSMYPIHTGYLIKSPPDTRVTGKLKRWLKRWFVLWEDKTLQYFQDRGDARPKNTIDLNRCEFLDTNLSDKKFKFIFSIGIAGVTDKDPGRTYYLAAESDYQMKNWIDKICTLCEFKETEKNNNTDTVIRHQFRSENVHRRRDDRPDSGIIVRDVHESVDHAHLVPVAINHSKSSAYDDVPAPRPYTLPVSQQHSYNEQRNTCPLDVSSSVDYDYPPEHKYEKSSNDVAYDAVPPINRPLTPTYVTQPPQCNYDTLPSQATYDIPPTQSNYDTLPSEATYDTPPHHCNYDTLPSEATYDIPPTQCNYDTLPSEATYDIPPTQCNYDTLPSQPTQSTYSRVPVQPKYAMQSNGKPFVNRSSTSSSDDCGEQIYNVPQSAYDFVPTPVSKTSNMGQYGNYNTSAAGGRAMQDRSSIYDILPSHSNDDDCGTYDYVPPPKALNKNNDVDDVDAPPIPSDAKPMGMRTYVNLTIPFKSGEYENSPETQRDSGAVLDEDIYDSPPVHRHDKYAPSIDRSSKPGNAPKVNRSSKPGAANIREYVNFGPGRSVKEKNQRKGGGNVHRSKSSAGDGDVDEYLFMESPRRTESSTRFKKKHNEAINDNVQENGGYQYMTSPKSHEDAVYQNFDWNSNGKNESSPARRGHYQDISVVCPIDNSSRLPLRSAKTQYATIDLEKTNGLRKTCEDVAAKGI